MHLGIDVNAYSRKGSAAETDFVSTAKSLVILCPHECTAILKNMNQNDFCCYFKQKPSVMPLHRANELCSCS